MVSVDTPRRKEGLGFEANRCFVLCCLVALLGVTVFIFSPYSSESINAVKLSSPTTGLVGGNPAGINFSSPECRHYKGQHREDAELFIMYWAFPQIKTNGVFLEIGALDGVTFSNSFWYEKCLGWTGVLVEGHPVAAERLRKNRPNVVTVESAACEKNEGSVTFVGKPNGLSGDPEQMPDYFVNGAHKGYANGEGEETHEVQCRRLGTILEEAGVIHIDFWTLDVEGAEWTVLHSFDWDKVAVHILVIENDKDEDKEFQRRHDFLSSKGMVCDGKMYINEVWRNPSYPSIGRPTL